MPHTFAVVFMNKESVPNAAAELFLSAGTDNVNVMCIIVATYIKGDQCDIHSPEAFNNYSPFLYYSQYRSI